MKNTNKLLDAVKQYFALESEKELAGFLNISEHDVKSIYDGQKHLSIENKLTILNFIDYDKKKGLSLFEELEPDYLIKKLCESSFLNIQDFCEKTVDANLIAVLKKIRIISNDNSFLGLDNEECLCQFLRIKNWELWHIEKGNLHLDWIPRLRIMYLIYKLEISTSEKESDFFRIAMLDKNVPDEEFFLLINPFGNSPDEDMVTYDYFFTEIILMSLINDSVDKVNDRLVLDALKEKFQLSSVEEIARFIGVKPEEIDSVYKKKCKISKSGKITLIFKLDSKEMRRDQITEAHLRKRIGELRKKPIANNVSLIDMLKALKSYTNKEIRNYLGIKDNKTFLAIQKNEESLDAFTRFNVWKIIKPDHLDLESDYSDLEVELALNSNSFLLKLIDWHEIDQSENIGSKENNAAAYKPEGLNRLLWLAAKNIAIPDPEFGYKDLVLFAMSLHSGCKLGDIRVNDMVDAAICALGEYYRHAGINEINLGNLLKPFRTEYALMINEKFNQDDGSRKIIEACMTQLMLAPMRSEDKQIVDLGNSDVSYEEVWERAVQEQNKYHEQRVAGIHKKCREDGEAKCLRWYEPVWLEQVTEEERRNMGPNECMCERAKDRKIIMTCDFKIDESGDDVLVEY